ncbi:MAG: ATP-binding cassette domain-containing protein [Acidimicrobiales bacterium]
MATEADVSTRTGIRVSGLRKTYGETVALGGLDLAASPGEVLGIAGPNGAGKSTLIKILAGEVVPDEGEVFIDGAPWTPALGARTIAVVHQEPELFPNLTVAQNLLVGREDSQVLMRRPGRVELDLLADLQIAEHARDQLGLTPLAVQQKTEIARALIHDARVVLFDEPNSALTEEESDELFRRVRLLADNGHVVMLVSHRLSELADNADRVIVIVDGKVSARLAGPDKTKERIAEELVVGVDTSSTDQRRSDAASRVSSEDIVLHLRDWSVKGSPVDGVEVVLPAGQVTAFVGVEGSGGRALVQSLAGIAPARGDVAVGDTDERGGLANAAFVAANRQDSLFGNLSVGENLVVRLGDQLAGPLGFLNRRAARRLAETGRTELLVKAASVRQPIGDLSGGNQQKVAIGSAMMTKPRLLVLEEPTRGVDIASKGEIYAQLHEYAAQGNAVAMFCTEDVEVFEAADVVHVVSKGHVSPAIAVSDFADVKDLAVELAGREHQYE